MTTTDTTAPQGSMASLAQLADLWRELAADLRRCLSGKGRSKPPSAELLGVTRRFLRDNSQTCPDEAARKALEALYRLYLRRLAEALEVPEGGRVSASHLAEARALLSWHGVGDLPAAAAGKVAQQLHLANVPFKMH